MKKILVAVDGSAHAMKAARLARDIAEGMRASLTVVYSVVPMMMPGDVPFTVVSEVQQAGLTAGKQILAEVVKDLGGTATPLEVEGPAAMRIAELAEAEGFDLVVVGSRGRNALARIVLGSVADRLVHLCSKPVLVVH